MLVVLESVLNIYTTNLDTSKRSIRADRCIRYGWVYLLVFSPLTITEHVTQASGCRDSDANDILKIVHPFCYDVL